VGLRLVLPEPISSNRYWRNFRGRIVKSKEARDYQELVKIRARLQGAKVMEGPVKLTIHWYRGRRSGDLSNRCKVVEDSLQGVVFQNDSQVTELHMYRYEDKGHPRIEVEVA